MARLEERGWVRRMDCPTDRRGQIAMLTDPGFAALSAAAPGHVEQVRRVLFDALSTEQLQQLDKISAAILAKAATSPTDADGCPPRNCRPGGPASRAAGAPPSLHSAPMEKRILGRTGRAVSVVGLGTWQLGADWGDVDEKDARAVLEAAAATGTTFLDTADVYGDGRSERIIGQFLAANPGAEFTVATKMGRRVAQDPGFFTLDNFRAWTDRSRANLGMDRLDLVQLHCPPTPVFSTGAVYDALDTLVAEERIAAYGVSVETCAEALTAIARPGTATVQIILNAFRRKPLDEVLPAARAARVGIIARVPLASGLLSGRYTHETSFPADDHRTFNRHGEAFDAGETFSGVDFDTGVDAAREFAALAPAGATPAQAALRWVIQQPGVSTVIPGARNPEQAEQNAAAAALPPFSDATLAAIADLYDRRIRAQVHDRW